MSALNLFGVYRFLFTYIYEKVLPNMILQEMACKYGCWHCYSFFCVIKRCMKGVDPVSW